MDDIRQIVVDNLIQLRKSNNMTQMDLAAHINYSDKAISRWENGEVLPNVEALDSIAKIYNVPITYLFERHVDDKEQKSALAQRYTSKIFITALTVCVIWTIATIVYVYLDMFEHLNYWQAFIWAIPATCIVTFGFNRRWYRKKILSLVLISLFFWSLITAIFLHFLSHGYNLWQLFLVGIPLQITSFIAYFMK